MGANRVTIFSNGIADFRRSYSVKKESPAEISLPVRKDHIADVLSSLNVYGQVSVKSPPSFRPSNEAEGNLSIDSGQVIEGLAKRLAGARVAVQKGGGETKGKLVGLHSDETINGLTKVTSKYLIVLSDDGLQRISIGEIQSLRFEDEAVQSEIDKALQRNFESIKPNSTFVELALTTDQDDAEAVVQYTVPAAAWKISYRLRQADQGSFEFQGFAIVDNNTEEDWKDFFVSVVTGEPITFSTDLADSKTPGRKHVNIVRDMALGAVEAEGAEMFMMGASVVAAAPDDLTDYHDTEDDGRVRQMRKAGGGRVWESAMRLASAETADAEIRETGDFCVFEASTPFSIGANRSAVLPVFNPELFTKRRENKWNHRVIFGV